jgi:hypothetical protein
MLAANQKAFGYLVSPYYPTIFYCNGAILIKECFELIYYVES